ncbi:Leucine rich repeat variant [compost metagenome]
MSVNYQQRYDAENPQTPLSTLETLSSSDDPGVRIAVARNKSTPLETLLLLTKDRIAKVKSGAIDTLCTKAEMSALSRDHQVLLSKGVPTRIIESLAKNDNLAHDVFARLAKAGKSVRYNVARNKATPAAMLLSMIVSDKDINVCAAAWSTAAEFEPSYWERSYALKEWSLDMPIDGSTPLGDALLAKGQQVLYQKLLSSELCAQICASAEASSQDLASLVASPRTRLLRM